MSGQAQNIVITSGLHSENIGASPVIRGLNTVHPTSLQRKQNWDD